MLVPDDPGAPIASVTGTGALLDISSTFDMLTLVDPVSEAFGRLAGLDEESVHHLGVAVREAVVNGIKHGNDGDPGKRVRVGYGIANDGARRRVVVRVHDEGAGFDAEHLADPLAPENVAVTSGRGVFLMRTFMDDVQVRRLPAGGTEIVMAKAIGRTLPAR